MIFTIINPNLQFLCDFNIMVFSKLWKMLAQIFENKIITKTGW